MAGRTLAEVSQIVDISWYSRRNKLYEIVNTEERFFYHLDKMKNAKLIGFDTETTGLAICCLPWGSDRKDKCVGLCISYKKNQGIYIPLLHTQFANMDMDLVVKYLFPLLETLNICTHNGLFDYKVMYDMGCKLNIVHDSMLLIFNIYSKVAKGSKKLKYITKYLYGDETVEFEDIFPNKGDYGRFKDIQELVCRIYACADSDYTRMIVVDNYDTLDDKQKAAYLRDVSFIPLIATSEYFGKPVDISKLPQYISMCKQNIKNLEETLYNYVGWKMTGELDERFEFSTTSNSELVDVLYYKLKYKPVDVKNKTGYKIDKFVRKKLNERKTDEEDLFVKTKLPQGIPNLLDESRNMVEYSDILHAECVPSLLIDALRKQQKQLTAFFNKIITESDGESGIYFSSISMTNTETARLVDFLQTLDGGLKNLIKVPDINKQYMFVFDFSQIEYRVMVALANMHALCKRLNDSHVDFHRECAGIIKKCPPEHISSKVRKQYKPINFGIPYGMAAKGLLSAVFGIGLSAEEAKIKLAEVEEMLKDWYAAMPEIVNMLNSYRSIAKIPRAATHPIIRDNTMNPSYIHCPDGRTRVFDLKDCAKQTLGKIERMAGNTPIQSFARTIFLTAVLRFRNRLIEDDLMDIKVSNDKSPSGFSFHNKITINAYIHDEIFGFVDNDVNPYYLYGVIRDCCMLQLDGHPTYYCGINICNDWQEGKIGPYEAPIDFVDQMRSNEMIVEPRNNWPEYVGSQMTDWVNKESVNYIEKLAGEDLRVNKFIDMDKILPIWKDYYYKTKLEEFGYSYRKSVKKESDEAALCNNVVGTLLKNGYSEVILKYSKENIHVKVSSKEDVFRNEFKKETDPKDALLSEVDIEELEEDYESCFLDGDEEVQEEEVKVDLSRNVSILETSLFR